jgi:hypothetical protein
MVTGLPAGGDKRYKISSNHQGVSWADEAIAGAAATALCEFSATLP